MQWFVLVLRVVGPILIGVGCLHLIMGLGADVLLGANVPSPVMADPVLDSQNRFYGVAFTLYGALLLLCSIDIRKYRVILQCVFWAFFAAGMSRLVSLVIYGLPTTSVFLLFAFEVLWPPMMVMWLGRTLTRGRGAR